MPFRRSSGSRAQQRRFSSHSSLATRRTPRIRPRKVACVHLHYWDITARDCRKTKRRLPAGRHTTAEVDRESLGGLTDEIILFGTAGVAGGSDRASAARAGRSRASASRAGARWRAPGGRRRCARASGGAASRIVHRPAGARHRAELQAGDERHALEPKSGRLAAVQPHLRRMALQPAQADQQEEHRAASHCLGERPARRRHGNNSAGSRRHHLHDRARLERDGHRRHQWRRHLGVQAHLQESAAWLDRAHQGARNL